MQRVLILGATSAVAAQIAELYARRGARLHLVGRNADKLQEVAARCDAAAGATTATADFLDVASNEAVVAEACSVLSGLDVVLIAHGLLGDQLATERCFDEAASTLHTNFTSVVSLLIPLANHLEAQRSGRLGVITSVAGERGRPRNYTYGAAKGALNVYLQGLRSRLYGSGVGVTTIKLGPVDTPMTVNHPKTRLFATPERVAPSIMRALERGAAEVYVPSFWRLIMPVVRAAPESVFQRLPFLSGR